MWLEGTEGGRERVGREREKVGEKEKEGRGETQGQGREGEESHGRPACLPTRPVPAGSTCRSYLGDATGPAAGQQLTGGAEAVLIKAGGRRRQAQLSQQ